MVYPNTCKEKLYKMVHLLVLMFKVNTDLFQFYNLESKKHVNFNNMKHFAVEKLTQVSI